SSAPAVRRWPEARQVPRSAECWPDRPASRSVPRLAVPWAPWPATVPRRGTIRAMTWAISSRCTGTRPTSWPTATGTTTRRPIAMACRPGMPIRDSISRRWSRSCRAAGKPRRASARGCRGRRRGRRSGTPGDAWPQRGTRHRRSGCAHPRRGGGGGRRQWALACRGPRPMPDPPKPAAAVRREQAEDAVRVLLRWAGEDPQREGLLDTPKRVVKAYRDWFSGYALDPDDYLQRTFEEVAGYDELIVLRDIEFESHCEHHMAPIIGRVHVGYLPDGQDRKSVV